MVKIVPIIPARSGSKRIKNKNIRLFKNKPLLAHSIFHSLESKLIQRTIVSTDSKEIAQISKKYGAEFVSRPDNISTDISTTESAIQHVLTELKNTNNYITDITLETTEEGT